MEMKSKLWYDGPPANHLYSEFIRNYFTHGDERDRWEFEAALCGLIQAAVREANAPLIEVLSNQEARRTTHTVEIGAVDAKSFAEMMKRQPVKLSDIVNKDFNING